MEVGKLKEESYRQREKQQQFCTDREHSGFKFQDTELATLGVYQVSQGLEQDQSRKVNKPKCVGSFL